MIFRYTILYVADVPAALDFYQNAFGIDLFFLHEGKDYGELRTGETKLAFSSRDLIRRLGKSPIPAQAEAPTFEIAFEVNDVLAAFDKAIKAGATSQQEPRDEPWGQTTSYVSDPDGYLIEICSPVQVPSAG